ncbi:MAG: DNA topoisomerase I [Planctomycetes bacterium]|nr:DNA topoisomerase I [Planctomycetota bacterium]
MNELLQLLLPTRLLQPLFKPLVRLFLGFVAIPIFRLFVHRVVKVQELDEELERDLELWFRGSLLLLIATQNMESTIFFWVRQETRDSVFFMAGRLLLAISVIEGMPDQSLFALIYPGPQPPKLEKGQLFSSIIRYIPQFLKGLLCQHLNRSSPVLAILAVISKDFTVGWVCYGMAISQYLLIGLVASKDKALGVLQKFDEAVARQRQEIEQEAELLLSARQHATDRLDDQLSSEM